MLIPNSEFILDVDTVIVAIGNGSNPLISQTTPQLNVNKWGNIIVDETQKTSMDRIFAGGDIVLGRNSNSCYGRRKTCRSNK